MLILAVVSLVFSLIPAIIYVINVRYYRPAPQAIEPLPSVSVLIPARNEELSIGDAVKSVMASEGIDYEVIVMDDHSTDATKSIVEQLGAIDPRVKVETAPELPQGWNGKQHACHYLSTLAKHDYLLFMDADVRLTPTGLARMVSQLHHSKADLLSGIPMQHTGTILEKLLIPLIHFIMLGFLPMWAMKRSAKPGYGAGCGQLFLARRYGYLIAGGHEAIKWSMHDGIQLPRTFRRHGRLTDLVDTTDIAECRMYRTGRQVWYGLMKNAREGIASNQLIAPMTAMFLAGQVLPFIVLFYAIPTRELLSVLIASIGAFAVYLPRFDACERFKQEWLGALFHPVAIILLLVIQWIALGRAIIGKPVGWKGRSSTI